MITEEEFFTLYDATNGFQEKNQNHPDHAPDESLWDYISSGCDYLLNEYGDLVIGMI